MKSLKWTLCFALVAAFLWAAGTASAGTDTTTIVLRATGFAMDPTLNCPAGSMGFTMTFVGLDDCGGASSFTMTACSPDGYSGTNITFDIVYTEGGTLTGTAPDFWQGQTGPRCMYSLVPPFHVDITGGTGEFEGAKGSGDGALYTYSANCGGNSSVMGSLNLKIRFPKGGSCPNDSDETSD